MGTASRRLRNGVAALGLGTVALAGCQTYPAGFGGMTLPSPHYLKHQPQYFPPDPAFPLQRELNGMQDPEGLGRGGIAGPLAAPAPGPAQPPIPPLTAPTPGVTAPVPAQVQPPAPVGGAVNPPGTTPPVTPGTGR